MRSKYVIVSYYTKNTPYEKIAGKFIESLKSVGFCDKYYVAGINSFGTWNSNTNYKPSFIYNCLQKFQRPVIWIDCDAIVREAPILFDSLTDRNVDLAFHKRRKREVLTGTLFVNYNNKVMDFLSKWIDMVASNPNVWEQKNLQTVLQKEQHDLFVYDLPASYCCIYDLMPKNGEITTMPIIEHFQASRKLKHTPL